MKITHSGSPDGIEVRAYHIGEAYDLPDSLATVFLREGWAELDKSMDGPQETKEKRKKK
jgi:hypothetical protein